MNGQTLDYNFDYEKYLKSLEDTGEPIQLEDIPPVRCDMRGISNYAKKKGVAVPELSEEEKEMFKIYKNVKNN